MYSLAHAEWDTNRAVQQKGVEQQEKKEEETQIKDTELIIYTHRIQKINLVVHKSQT